MNRLRSSDTRVTCGIEYSVVFSRRRTLAISILPDASVIVRAPYRTGKSTIARVITRKTDWIRKHVEEYRKTARNRLSYENGEAHLFRGKYLVINVSQSTRPFVMFNGNSIEIGTGNLAGAEITRRLLYLGYKREAEKLFPGMLRQVIEKYQDQDFRPSSMRIRTMKRRWGSCSSKSVITLSTELVRLPDELIEYVILHELCHLKHHNHGPLFYKLMTELCPGWKSMRKELKNYQQY